MRSEQIKKLKATEERIHQRLLKATALTKKRKFELDMAISAYAQAMIDEAREIDRLDRAQDKRAAVEAGQ